MTSQMIIGIVVTGYMLAVGGLFAIEFIKSKRKKDHGHTHHLWFRGDGNACL